MDEDAASADIARIEEHIEALRLSIARCRKIDLAAKLTIAIGAGVLALMLFGPFDFMATPFIAGLAAVIGGIVLAGSNSTTWKQTQGRLHNSEMLRAEMIGALPLRTVNGNGSAPLIGPHHQ
jgi:hypothetical protein